MKLTRGKRIAFELLGPPALGAMLYSFAFACFGVWEVTASDKNLWRTCGEVGTLTLMVFAFAYIFVGAQSIIYTVLMEWRFKRGLDPQSWSSVWLSTALGTGSGGAVGLFMGMDSISRLEPMLFWCGFGLVVGFIMGLLIKHWSTERIIPGKNLP